MKLSLLCLLVCFLVMASENTFERFHEANQAFDKGEYQTAIQHYQEIVAQGFESGDLHFNLGNAFFKSANLGRSIFHYRRALELSPRDPDLKFNLSYAREKVVDQIESRESLWSRLGAFCKGVSKKESYYVLLVVTALLVVASVVALYKTHEWIKWLRNGLVATCVVSLIVVAYHSFLQEPFGVVIAPEAKVYSAVGKDNVVLFTLHAGVEVFVADSIGNEWVRIRLSDGKQGWIKVESIDYQDNS